jgi:hypothetical protein
MTFAIEDPEQVQNGWKTASTDSAAPRVSQAKQEPRCLLNPATLRDSMA